MPQPCTLLFTGTKAGGGTTASQDCAYEGTEAEPASVECKFSSAITGLESVVITIVKTETLDLTTVVLLDDVKGNIFS